MDNSVFLILEVNRNEDIFKLRNDSKDYWQRKAIDQIYSQMICLDHPFSQIHDIFNNFIINRYSGEISQTMINEIINEFCTNVLYLRQILFEAVVRFYNIKDFEEIKTEIYFQHFITQFVMRDNVYETAYKLFAIKQKEKIRNIQIKIEKYRGIRLKDLKISLYFQFDEYFRKKFKRKHFNKHQMNSNHFKRSSMMDKFSMESLSNNIELNRNSLLIEPNKNSAIKGNIKRNLEPLYESIQLLCDLRNIQSPSKKLSQLKLIHQTCEETIKEFWSNYDIDENKLEINADLVLSLMIYLIIKSGYSSIIVDHDLISEFRSQSENKGKKAYLLNNLFLAIEFIIGSLNDEFFRGNEEPSASTNIRKITQFDSLLINKADEDYIGIGRQNENRIQLVHRNSFTLAKNNSIFSFPQSNLPSDSKKYFNKKAQFHVEDDSSISSSSNKFELEIAEQDLRRGSKDVE